jgi:type IX secretion system PorP/SprF family membrane protein
MKRLFLSLYLIIVSILVLNAQQDAQFSHYMFNNAFINPGAAGSSGKVCATAIARNQWQGFGDGAPTTFAGNVSAPFTLFGASHGAGLKIYNDTYGFNNDISLSLSYALQINMGDGKLGVGLNGGFINSALNGAVWEYTGEDNGGGLSSPASGDNAIPQGGEDNATVFNAGLGLYYSSEDIYFGVSATNVLSGLFLEPTIEYKGSENSSATYAFQRHYYLTAGYTLQLPNPSFELLPSILLKSDGKSSQIDINTLLQYNKKFWGGVSIRTSDIIFLAGLELMNNLRLGISYDISTSKIIGYQSGSFEIMLNYCFEIKKEKALQKYRSIRYL